MSALVKTTLDLNALRTDAATDEQARLVLGDLHEERGEDAIAALLRDKRTGPQVAPGLHRPEVMRLWLDDLPKREHKTRARVDAMTDAERKKMPEWAQRWIAVGLSTERADRPMFEAAVSACYRHSGLAAPHVVWCNSPIEAAIAGPIASYLLYGRKFINNGLAVDGAVGDAVDGAVRGAVGDAVMSRKGPNGFSREGVEEVRRVLSDTWWRYMGGQFWVGWGWGWGSPSYVSFMLDVLRLDIGKEMELRARAYAATASSACWWWPGRDFVLVSERPKALEFTKRDKRLKRAAWEGWEVKP